MSVAWAGAKIYIMFRDGNMRTNNKRVRRFVDLKIVVVF